MEEANANDFQIMSVGTDPDLLELIRETLSMKGHHVISCVGVEKAIRILEFGKVDIVVSEMDMPRISGMDLLRHVKENFPEIEMTVYGRKDVNTAVNAVKIGAEDYLVRPFDPDKLSDVVERMGRKASRRRRVRETVAMAAPHGMVGQSDAVKTVYRLVKKAASATVNALIYGESGTGKELVARAIHYNSDRSHAPFVPVNCTAIPDTLLESELFGHVKGAFTGARESRSGFFQIADGGTIFLDEIGDASLNMQGKLLRVLQNKEIHIVGSSHPRKVDTRIIAATHKDLQAMVAKGQFREDLYYRLNVIDITVPPLRERKDDLLFLVHHFSDKFSKEVDRTPPVFSDETLRAMKSYHWPGNVRELENLIQRLVVIVDAPVVRMPDMPPHMRFQAEPAGDRLQSLSEVETAHIRTVLAAVGGNKTRASEVLGIDRKTLRTKLNAGAAASE
jgi:DNA-binding NtrC family response regulator